MLKFLALNFHILSLLNNYNNLYWDVWSYETEMSLK